MRYGAHPHTDWPQEREEELRRLWNDEALPAGEIARKLGLSRNQVIGKARRMKLNKRAEKERIIAARASTMVLKVPRPYPDKALVLDLDGKAPLYIAVWDLEGEHCRWPVAGEREFTLFCGHPKRVGSYCHKHARQGYGRRPND